MKIWISIFSLLALLASPLLHAEQADDGDKQETTATDGEKGDSKDDKDKDKDTEEEPDCD